MKAEDSKADDAKPQSDKPQPSLAQPDSGTVKAVLPGSELERRDYGFRSSERPPLVSPRHAVDSAQDGNNQEKRQTTTSDATAKAERDTAGRGQLAQQGKTPEKSRGTEAPGTTEVTSMDSPTLSEIGGAALAPSQWRREWGNSPNGQARASADRSGRADASNERPALPGGATAGALPLSSAAFPPANSTPETANTNDPATSRTLASQPATDSVGQKAIRLPSAPIGHSSPDESASPRSALDVVPSLPSSNPAAIGHSPPGEQPASRAAPTRLPPVIGSASAANRETSRNAASNKSANTIVAPFFRSDASPAARDQAAPTSTDDRQSAAALPAFPSERPPTDRPPDNGKPSTGDRPTDSSTLPLFAPRIAAPESAAPESPGMALAVSDEPPPQAEAPQAETKKAASADKATATVTVTANKAAPAKAEMPAAAAAKEEKDDKQVVKVFYGTDRLALESPTSGQWGHADWAYLTAICGAVALVLGAIAYCHPRNRVLLTMASTTVLGTGALAFVTFHAGREAPSPENAISRVYGNNRGTLELGVCQVTIPKQHKTGEMERPSVFRLQFREDPQRHIVLLSVERQAEDAFFTAMKARVDESEKKEVMVFVHGFNVTFEEAAMRTAQLAYDLKIDGAPAFFSWPSQGGLLRYAIDETNVAWSVPHLKEFLVNVAQRSGAQSVNVIAHSMGNRALAAALQILSYEMNDKTPLFQQVVLTAPDIDADVFKRDIAPRIVKTADRVTLYASSNDEALKLSKELHGYPRAGDSGPGLIVLPGIDTIDVTTVDTSLIGHSYYGSNNTVLQDLFDLLSGSKPPDQRTCLRAVPLGEMNYWVFIAARAGLNASRKAEDLLRK